MATQAAFPTDARVKLGPKPNTTTRTKALSLPERGALGALAGICTTFATHPLDVIRVQMQVAQNKMSTLNTAMNVARQGGVTSLYAGISAAWLRQVTYGSARLGIYSWLLEQSNQRRQAKGDISPTPFLLKLSMGLTSGCIGAMIGNPSELALVRMGADQSLPLEQRRNYKSSIDCCIRVAKEEGPAALMKGVGPTVIRAAALNGTLLATTSELKQIISRKTGWTESSVPNMFASVLIASFLANAVSTPFDVIKSRLQQASVGQYDGMIHCLTVSTKKDGFGVLWTGFTPAFVKLAPYSIISLTILEKLSKLYTGGAGAV